MQVTKTSTGCIIVDGYTHGKLETLSIGDYGKAINIKANFLGRTSEIHGVPNGQCVPLQEKWVMTLSTQYGCSMRCTFCDVPSLGKAKHNVSQEDMLRQIIAARNMFPEVPYTDRLNIHFARMGEPLFNDHVILVSEYLHNFKGCFQEAVKLRVETIHPVLTTMLPRTIEKNSIKDYLMRWDRVKNVLYSGQAGLQLSINSTDEEQRNVMFRNGQTDLETISWIVSHLSPPLGRKYCLNFAWDSSFKIDGKKLAGLFDPEKWMCKITPIHNNSACKKNHLKTEGGYNSYPYKVPEDELLNAGFDVIVFVPSMDEEKGLITCGNAILSRHNA